MSLKINSSDDKTVLKPLGWPWRDGDACGGGGGGGDVSWVEVAI